MKLTVDGALFMDFQVIGVGPILRDHQGDVLLATSIKEQGIQDPETIEMLVVLRGLQTCLTLGLSNVIIESDCQFIV